jgi:SAM-dependent methyltransferase
VRAVNAWQLKVMKRVFGAARLHARHPEILRASVGGMWEKMGKLQFDYLVAEGLKPHHNFLDVGCGVLRAGIPLIDYLEAGRYCGLDASSDILEAARVELGWAGLEGKKSQLLHSRAFEFERFGRSFDYAIAQSVFSHIGLNDINVCLQNMQRVLAPGGRFYATFFENPAGTRALGTVEHPRPDGPPTVTYPDRDPFHYGVDAFEWLVQGTQLSLRYIGDWGQPRGQRMLLFTRSA